MFAHGVQLMQESLGDSLPADKCLELLRATDGNVTVAINLFLDGGAGDVDSRLPSFEAARSFPIAPPPSALGLYQRGLDRSAAELDALSNSAEAPAPAPAATPTPAPTAPTATPQPERDDSSGRVEDAIAEITAQNVAEMTAALGGPGRAPSAAVLEGYLREAGDDVAGALNLFIDRELQECEEEASFSRAASEASRVSRANSSESVGGGGGGGGSGGVAAAFPEPPESAPSRLEADYDQHLQLAVASTDGSGEETINFDLLLNGSLRTTTGTSSPSLGSTRLSHSPASARAGIAERRAGLTLDAAADFIDESSEGGPSAAAAALTPLEQKCAELRATEAAYVDDLRTLIEVYMPPPPLLELDRALLTHEERVKIFNNVEEIKRCNEALFAALSRDGEPVRTLALAFLELAPYLKLYSHYCACYDGALAELRRKRGASAEFDAFLAAGRSKARGLGVEDFLIKPVQRLTKYPLFFDEVLALLPAEHECQPQLQKAERLVRAVAHAVNNHDRGEAGLRSLLAKLPKEYLPLLAPHRRLKHTFECTVAAEGGVSFDAHGALMTDALLLCRRKGGGGGETPREGVLRPWLLAEVRLLESTSGRLEEGAAAPTLTRRISQLPIATSDHTLVLRLARPSAADERPPPAPRDSEVGGGERSGSPARGFEVLRLEFSSERALTDARDALEAAQGEQTRLARNMADRHAAVRLGLEPPVRALADALLDGRGAKARAGRRGSSSLGAIFSGGRARRSSGDGPGGTTSPALASLPGMQL